MKVPLNLVFEPKISVIITYFNLSEYIRPCIESILNQTYKNFEIIIVNDGSDENNSKILNEIKNEKIKIINSKENMGQLGAFLLGVDNALGEFICMVDADDVLLPNYLKTLLYIHLNYNAAFVSSSSGEINKNGEITSLNYVSNNFQNNLRTVKYCKTEEIFDTNDEFEISILDLKNTPFGLWSWRASTSAMIRKSAIEILKFYPDIKYWKTGADKVIFSLLHLIGGSINTNAVLWLYRQHSLNNSNTNLSTGNKKFLKESYIKKLIDWNIKLRLDTVKMFIKNRKEFIEIFSKTKYYKMLFSVIFCVNKKVCAKIIKTFAHG